MICLTCSIYFPASHHVICRRMRLVWDRRLVTQPENDGFIPLCFGVLWESNTQHRTCLCRSYVKKLILVGHNHSVWKHYITIYSHISHIHILAYIQIYICSPYIDTKRVGASFKVQACALDPSQCGPRFPLFPGQNEMDQIQKIHNVLGTPSPDLLQSKFKRPGPTPLNVFWPFRVPVLWRYLAEKDRHV